MFRKLRIVLLLLVLATVAQTAWLAKSRATNWTSSVGVAVYPIAGDGSGAVGAYIAKLNADQFDPIEEFFEREAKRYGVDTWRPVDVSLAPPIASLPPAAPTGGNPLRAILWSLEMRYWAWRHDAHQGPKPQVRLYVVYHDPAQTGSVAHSLGLEKGLIGVIHAFASRSMGSQNNVIIAHELLHTLGATDKYDPTTNQPRFPDGYAEPERTPPTPQEEAEIMGGRTPISESESEIPRSLQEVIVGPATAREINWIKG
ncbi:MAG: hypothetical protein WBP72_16445 [Rhodocyclaceae bacterium]